MRVNRGKFRCAVKSGRVTSTLIRGSQAKKQVALQAVSLVSPRCAAATKNLDIADARRWENQSALELRIIGSLSTGRVVAVKVEADGALHIAPDPRP
jgi:hypothetical protein